MVGAEQQSARRLQLRLDGFGNTLKLPLKRTMKL
jgi:hypothetical protein